MKRISIRTRFFVFSLAVFLFVAGGGSGAFVIAMRQMVRRSAGLELSRLLETKRLTLESQVNAEIAIALKMAGSPIIQRYFLDPGDPQLEYFAFEEIAGYRRAFAGNTLFWISDADKRFYSDDAYSYTLDPENPAEYWYKMTLYETEVYNFNINYNEHLKKTMLWINAPVFADGAPIGIVGTGIDLSGFIDSVYTGFDTRAVELYLFNEQEEITGAEDSSLIIDKVRIADHIENGGGAIAAAAKALDEKAVKTFMYGRGEAAVIRIPLFNWYMAAMMPFTFSMYTGSSMTIIFAAVLATVFAILLIFNLFIIRALKPLRDTIRVLNDIAADWDLTRRLGVRSRDEFGELAEFFNMTFGKMGELISVIKRKTLSLADTGEELASNTTETAAAITEIASNIGNIRNRAHNLSQIIQESAQATERIMTHINKLNGQIAEQAGSVSRSSSAAGQLLESIRTVTGALIKNTENINTLAESAGISRNDLQKVSGDIQEIARESEGLMEINSVIENIASQTNLLSMNAAIEAAHAGESGKGFAVVAGEIRKLAVSSSDQSKTIGAVLKKIKESIDSITNSTSVVIKRFEAIEQEVQTVSAGEAGIRSAMEEQETGGRHILEAVSRLNELTVQVKTQSGEMAAESKEVLQQSKSLENMAVEIAGSMEEMATGADQINAVTSQVSAISGKNKASIEALNGEIAKFKVAD
ncbi:MAG: methyl-accepting chemotaxis protein [Treponema sp.]|jgi:methyl-accepting chemotaxis protein|nr:methyl-accepting chemotaxis protein [Treponema sp.]